MRVADPGQPPRKDGRPARVAQRQLVLLALLLGATNLVLPVAMVVFGVARGDHYSEIFYAEQNPGTWLSSVQLLIIAAVAYTHFTLAGVAGRDRTGGRARHRWVWLVFAAGFTFLSLDERFEIHEWLRDNVLQPREVLTDLRWVAPGDVLLYAYFVVGAVFTVFLAGELRRHRPALLLFAAALALALCVVIVDALPERITDEWGDGYFFTAIFEEVGELWSELLFLLAFLALLHRRLEPAACRSEVDTATGQE